MLAVGLRTQVSAEPGGLASSKTAIPSDRVVEAVTKARSEIAQNPNSASAYLLLGSALRVGGDLPGADKALDQALRLDPKLSNAWFEKGLIALQNGTIETTQSFF